MLNCLMFADDMALLADNPEAITEIVKRIHMATKKWGMSISVKKTEVLSVGDKAPLFSLMEKNWQ